MTFKEIAMEFAPPLALAVFWTSFLYPRIGSGAVFVVLSVGASGYVLGSSQARREFRQSVVYFQERIVDLLREVSRLRGRHLYSVDVDQPPRDAS